MDKEFKQELVDFLLYVSDVENWFNWWDNDNNCPLDILEWRGDPDIASQAVELLLKLRTQ